MRQVSTDRQAQPTKYVGSHARGPLKILAREAPHMMQKRGTTLIMTTFSKHVITCLAASAPTRSGKSSLSPLGHLPINNLITYDVCMKGHPRFKGPSFTKAFSY